MEAKFIGLALSQQERPAKGQYPATWVIKFVEAGTGNEFEVTSSVKLDPAHLLKAMDWTLLGFFAGRQRYFDKDSGQEKSFFQVKCENITGVVQKS
jgi:hypothetical protein